MNEIRLGFLQLLGPPRCLHQILKSPSILHETVVVPAECDLVQAVGGGLKGDQ